MQLFQIESIVRVALTEDIGTGDITALTVVPESVTAEAKLLAKAPGVLAGIEVAETAFRLVGPCTEFEKLIDDGTYLEGRGEVIALIRGNARDLLGSERVALNFLQRLSGVATLTKVFADTVAGTRARIIDTRKTTPGLRIFEKYAVRAGGGHNHRFGLSDGILIKDNHIVAAGGVGIAIAADRKHAPHTLKIEVETKELSQVSEALEAGADAILLDNMNLETLAKAVEIISGRALTEASGGVNLSNVRAIAETGVDLISVGALTHSAPALDISLDFLIP